MYKQISRLIKTLRVLKVMINCRRFYMKKKINFLMILELEVQKFSFIGLVFQHRISVSWNITVISIFQSPKHIFFFSFQQHISKVQAKNSAEEGLKETCVETQCLVEQTIVETNHRGFFATAVFGTIVKCLFCFSTGSFKKK